MVYQIDKPPMSNFKEAVRQALFLLNAPHADNEFVANVLEEIIEGVRCGEYSAELPNMQKAPTLPWMGRGETTRPNYKEYENGQKPLQSNKPKNATAFR